MSDEKKIALHWLVVGYVSPGAQEWITDIGGQVREVSSDPPLVAVGLAYNPTGAWTWHKGRQEHRQGIEYWSAGELQEASTGITLQYGNSVTPRTLAEYCSADSNYLILPDEEYDVSTGQIQEPGIHTQPIEAVTWNDALIDDVDDDHPF
jgi:hypothetical protein